MSITPDEISIQIHTSISQAIHPELFSAIAHLGTIYLGSRLTILTAHQTWKYIYTLQLSSLDKDKSRFTAGKLRHTLLKHDHISYAMGSHDGVCGVILEPTG